MREIKFRAWVKDDPNGVMQEVLLLDPIGKVVRLTDYGALAFREVELMQYTGLTDKNGKEIYEGDIVHYVYQPGEGYWNYDCTAVIEWRSTGWYMSTFKAHKSGLLESWLVSVPGANEPKLWEVVGNIYENPELLKQATR